MINENLTQLPEKWYIKTTQDGNVLICDWYEKIAFSVTGRNIGNYYGTDDNRNSFQGRLFNITNREIEKYFTNCQEISLSQFKRWVLKEDGEDTRMYLTVNELIEREIYKHYYNNKEEDLVGRWIKCITDKVTDCADIKTGQLYQIIGKFVERDNKIQWKTTYPNSNFYSKRWEIAKEFELMPIGFEPSTEKDEEKPKFEVGKWYQHLGYFDSIVKLIRLNGKDFYHFESLNSTNRCYTKINITYCKINDNTCEISIAEIQQWLPDKHPEKFTSSMQKKELIKYNESIRKELLEKANRDYPAETKFRGLNCKTGFDENVVYGKIINQKAFDIAELCVDYGVSLKNPKLIKINNFIVEDVGDYKSKFTIISDSTFTNSYSKIEHQQPIIYKKSKSKLKLIN